MPSGVPISSAVRDGAEEAGQRVSPYPGQPGVSVPKVSVCQEWSLTWLSCLPRGLLLWLLSYKEGNRTDANFQLWSRELQFSQELCLTAPVLNHLTRQ